MSALYRPCVGILLLNAQRDIFVGERIDNAGAWQMPQGGIDDGEDVHTAARRELYEEVGTHKAKIIRIASETVRYDLPDDLARSLWNGKYRGQEQTWVAMRFTGEDSDINLNAHTPAEFTAWKWLPASEILSLSEEIIPFKRALYRQVFELFTDLVFTFEVST